MTTAPYTDEQLEFLRAHRQAVLATGRRDGSPQVSTVVYAVDGAQVLISAKRYTSKHRNAARQPKVALVVNDGHAQLVVYGTAEAVEDDPLRAELTAKVWEAMTGEAVEDPNQLVPTLDEQQRSVIRVTADRVLFNP
jgi:PPOX class probable F420-dependent enzyme